MANLLWMSLASADTFDLYLNPILAKAPDVEGVKEVKQLTPDVISQHDNLFPGVNAAFLIVFTNEGRHSKLLVERAFRKVDETRRLPMLLVERFVTFKPGEERAVEASGRDLNLFAGFRFSLDIGQVVPEELGGDLRFVVDGDKCFLEPLGKAKIYLVTQPLPGVVPTKVPKLVMGDKFEPRYFNGTYKLYDDGRRSGTLTLKVEDSGEVTGSYLTDKDGSKYDVHGAIGKPLHTVQFTIQLPRVEQIFQGWLFTGDGKVLTGSSRMGEREAGFYAVRVEEEEK
jgi:hypothetical protein